VRLWRISDFTDLSGEGGLMAEGRWHGRGRRIVYLADHPASAVLEMMASQNLARDELPSRYQLLAIEVPDQIAFDEIGEATLPRDWRQHRELTRALGNGWLERGATSLARVPSALVPHAYNWLFNPVHDQAKAAIIVETIRADLDVRLTPRNV
jgi:RES domain-containing protein